MISDGILVKLKERRKQAAKWVPLILKKRNLAMWRKKVRMDCGNGKKDIGKGMKNGHL